MSAELQFIVSRIPAEGQEVVSTLDAAKIGLEGSEGFELQPGAQLSCRLERGDDATVHVQGRLTARLGVECGRCLESFVLPVEQRLDLFYLPHEEGLRAQEDEQEISERDLVVAFYDEDCFNLGEMVREQLLLCLPMKRLCAEECKGLCPSCGANRNQQPCGCRDESLDPRLAPLKALLDGEE